MFLLKVYFVMYSLKYFKIHVVHDVQMKKKKDTPEDNLYY